MASWKTVSSSHHFPFGFILACTNPTFWIIDKEIIDQHQKDIDELKNQAPPELPEIKGDGLDMGEMMKIFAAKTAPDLTIKRLEALENNIIDINEWRKNFKGEAAAPLELPFDANDLLQRV